MAWIHDGGPDPVPPEVLDRINYLGVPSTGPDGAHFPPRRDGPQAYLAVQGAQVDEIPSHFHSVEQFQYVVRGSGTIGSRPFSRGVLHYADRFTPYGPIHAGPQGLAYATLRASHDTGVFVMPAGQERLAQLLAASERPAADRRQHTVDLRAALGVAAPSAGSRWTEVCDGGDGFRIAVVALRARATAPVLTAAGGGAFLLVMVGTVEGEGGPYGAGAIRWHVAGETVPARAGNEGARLAFLQFPVAPAPSRKAAYAAPGSLA
jgi:hypothetical protein